MQLFRIIVTILQTFAIEGLFHLTGPYEASLKEFTPCESCGTCEMRFDIEPHRNEKDMVYSGSLYFKFPMGDGIRGETEVSKQGNGGWGRNSYKHKVANHCEDMISMSPSFMKALAKSANFEPKCPIPAGTYNVTELAMEFTVPFKELPYGYYRLKTQLKNRTHTVGCFIMYVDIAEKPKV